MYIYAHVAIEKWQVSKAHQVGVIMDLLVL